MKKEELYQYQNLTKFHRDVIDALLNLGFRHKYFSTYELIGWGEVKVDEFSRLSDVLTHVHQQGKDEMRFEFQRLLGL